MELKKGIYRLEERGLTFSLSDDLDFQSTESCFYFRGGNGFGKTSFLEKIIIPGLRSDSVPYLYIGQDMRTQLYTLRALLSVQGFKVAENDEMGLLRQWINNSKSATVFILDEFDKYFPDHEFIFDWSDSFIRTYIFVTHLGYSRPDAVVKKFKTCDVRFELIDLDGRLKNVQVRIE